MKSNIFFSEIIWKYTINYIDSTEDKLSVMQ